MWHYIGETRVKRCLCWCFRCPTMLPSLLAPKVGVSVFEDNPTIQWTGHFFGDSWVVFFPYFFVSNYETIGAGDGTGWNMMDLECIKNRLADTLQTTHACKASGKKQCSSLARWKLLNSRQTWPRAPRNATQMVKTCQDSQYKDAQGKCEAGSIVFRHIVT